MLATFCLRLACGLLGSLVLFFPLEVQPRIYRTHFLIALGLTGVAGLGTRETNHAFWWLSWALALGGALLGSLVWSVEGVRGGKVLAVGTCLTLALTLFFGTPDFPGAVEQSPGLVSVEPPPELGSHELVILADDLTSAALLGTVTTAMLLGHSYLIAPGMSIRPLMRLLGAFFAAVGLRLVIAAVGLYCWTAGHSLGNLEDVTVLWLPLRWGLGFVGPLVLGWMARQAARIRSTQSATGILYTAVVFTFLGELTSLLLLSQTGFLL